MAAATQNTSRGRPRKYSTDAARAQARRVKVRQYVQAHRERRKHNQASLDTDGGLDADANGCLEHHPSSYVIHWRSSKTSLALSNPATRANSQYASAPKTAVPKTFSRSNINCAANESSFNHVHQREPIDLPAWPHNAELVNPMTPLSAGRFDPFATTCSEFSMQPYDYEVLDHAITYQWPKFSCSSTASAIAAIKSDVTQAAMSNRASFYATLFAGSTHLAYRSIRAGLSVQDRAQARRLVYKVKAIEALRSEIALHQDCYDTDGLRLDSIVLCVLTLAAHGTGEDIVHQAKQNLASGDDDPTHFLATVQDVDYYSAMNCELQHWRIIEALVQRRGGLSAIQISGLANAIGLYDVFMARRTLSQPKFPVMLSSDKAVSALASMLPTHPMVVPTHSGFCEIFDDDLGGLHASLLEILHHLRIITAAIDMFDAVMKLRNLSPRDSDKRTRLLTAILWARHLVQHTLLSLPRDCPGLERPGGKLLYGKRLYELGHLTALVYCEMVISPILGAHEMRSALCKRLRNQLSWWHKRNEHEGDMTRNFVGWATLLCIMYCSNQVEKGEAALFLKHTLNAISEPEILPTRVTKWSDAKLYLGVEHFLWSSRFMDAKAQRVWNEFLR